MLHDSSADETTKRSPASGAESSYVAADESVEALAGFQITSQRWAVRVAEVPGVNAPRPVMCGCDRGACSFGSLKQLVDLVALFDQVAEAELAALRRVDADLCVLGEVAARIEAEDEAPFELEHRDRAVRAGLFVCPFGADDAVRAEAETIAVERERVLQVVDRKRDHVQALLHRPFPSSHLWGTRRVNRATSPGHSPPIASSAQRVRRPLCSRRTPQVLDSRAVNSVARRVVAR